MRWQPTTRFADDRGDGSGSGLELVALLYSNYQLSIQHEDNLLMNKVQVVSKVQLKNLRMEIEKDWKCTRGQDDLQTYTFAIQTLHQIGRFCYTSFTEKLDKCNIWFWRFDNPTATSDFGVFLFSNLAPQTKCDKQFEISKVSTWPGGRDEAVNREFTIQTPHQPDSFLWQKNS